MTLPYPWMDDDAWVSDERTHHQIRPWCVEESCIYCGAGASHKIEETTGPVNIHPMTAYVCCEHFFGHC